MKVISFITQKGGSGKTTSLLNVATHVAQREKALTLMIDLDPQRSALYWWESREHDNIGCLDINANKLTEALEVVRKKGFKYVFIDTPARVENVNNIAIRNSDFSILPCQPSLLDMRAAKATVESLKVLNKRGAFLITRANARGFRVEDAINALQVHGLPVCPISIVDRSVYRDSYAAGEGVIEYEPQGKAAKEVSDTWDWINKIMNKKMEIAA